MKDKLLTIKIMNKERKELKLLAKKAGHNSVAGFILWLTRQFRDGKLRVSKGRLT